MFVTILRQIIYATCGNIAKGLWLAYPVYADTHQGLCVETEGSELARCSASLAGSGTDLDGELYSGTFTHATCSGCMGQPDRQGLWFC